MFGSTALRCHGRTSSMPVVPTLRSAPWAAYAFTRGPRTPHLAPRWTERVAAEGGQALDTGRGGDQPADQLGRLGRGLADDHGVGRPEEGGEIEVGHEYLLDQRATGAAAPGRSRRSVRLRKVSWNAGSWAPMSDSSIDKNGTGPIPASMTTRTQTQVRRGPPATRGWTPRRRDRPPGPPWRVPARPSRPTRAPAAAPHPRRAPAARRPQSRRAAISRPGSACPAR